MFQTSDTTWLAYNRWPNWRSLYDLGDNPWGAGGSKVGYDVSFDRPYALYWNLLPTGFEPLTNGAGEFFLTEFSLAFWLEREGYDVTYVSNIDTHTDGKGLLRSKAFLSVGHDEYWTEQMFENVTKARDAGVSLAFLSGNSISGIVELLPSTDGRPNRVMRRVKGFTTEPELMGSTSYGVGLGDWIAELPDHWAFEGTDMKKGDRVRDLVGWEYHGPPLGNHKDIVVLAAGPVANGQGQPIEGRSYATDDLHRSTREPRLQCGHVLVEQGARGTASVRAPDQEVLQRRRRAHPADDQERAEPDDCRAGQSITFNATDHTDNTDRVSEIGSRSHLNNDASERQRVSLASGAGVGAPASEPSGSPRGEAPRLANRRRGAPRQALERCQLASDRAAATRGTRRPRLTCPRPQGASDPTR